MSDITYSYVGGIITGVLTTASVVGILGGVIFVLLRGWANHVNTCLKEIFDRFREETKQREERWRVQNQKCDAHTIGLAELNGRIKGDKK